MIFAKKIKLSILGLFLLILPLAGFSCLPTSDNEKLEIPPVTINYWRVWDSSSDFSDIIRAYETKYPHININYRKLRYSEVEDALIQAWARGTGPDILSIHNTWMQRYLPDLQPMPASTSIPQLVVTGPSWRKREEIVNRTTSLPKLNSIKTDFVNVVADDVVYSGKIYGLPMSIDSLVMYYNEDILNSAGIANPPTNWDDFKDAVKRLTFQDEEGNIIQSGVALGTANNIPRSMDILALLMMQNGTEMMNGSRVTFNQPSASNANYYPGREALRFYTDFADPTKEVYSWNSSMPDALDAFVSGKLAFFFGYSFHLDDIRSRAPKINFGVASMPQIDGNPRQYNYASYWVETVPNKAKNKNEAWDFIAFATARENVESYLKKAQRPTAIKSLINTQLQDLTMAPFAKQSLTADSWYQGRGAEYAEDIFRDIISQVNTGNDDYQTILNQAAVRLNSGVY